MELNNNYGRGLRNQRFQNIGRGKNIGNNNCKGIGNSQRGRRNGKR